VYFWLEPTFRRNVSPPSSGQVNRDENICRHLTIFSSRFTCPEDGGDMFIRNVGSNQKIHSARSQKMVSCIIIAVKTSNLTFYDDDIHFVHLLRGQTSMKALVFGTIPLLLMNDSLSWLSNVNIMLFIFLSNCRP
jgi:hypothetical protein